MTAQEALKKLRDLVDNNLVAHKKDFIVSEQLFKIIEEELSE